MSYKGRIKFSIVGTHGLLLFVRDLLIQNGLALVSVEEADFVVVGGYAGERVIEVCDEKPVILLSSHTVYSDRDFSLRVRDRVPMAEDDPILIPSTLDPNTGGILRYVNSENFFLDRIYQTMVLRIFNVYGPGSLSFGSTLLPDFIDCATHKRTIYQFAPGYQTRTYLHIDDFSEYVLRLVQKFQEGSYGIYNVGSTEEISNKRLGDTVWQLINGVEEETPVGFVESPAGYRWWVLPDMTRTQALTKYLPKISLRVGIWAMVSK